jgi:hypothetical protein
MKRTLILFICIFSLFGVNNAQTNILKNSGFEYPVAYTADETIYGKNYKVLVRAANFFDTNSQITYPTLSAAVAIPDTMWYKKESTTHYQLKNVIDTVFHTGKKSLSLWSIAGDTNESISKYYNYNNLTQKVTLDNSKTYEFKFWAKRNFIERATDNINIFRVGLIASNDAAVNTGTGTYTVDITMPENEDWNEIKVKFNLDSIVKANAALETPKIISFAKAAVLIAIKPLWDATNAKTNEAKLYVDDLSLKEVITSAIKSVNEDVNIKVIGRDIYITDVQNSVSIYNLLGTTLYTQKSNNSCREFSFKIKNQGLYLINADGRLKKVYIQ